MDLGNGRMLPPVGRRVSSFYNLIFIITSLSFACRALSSEPCYECIEVRTTNVVKNVVNRERSSDMKQMQDVEYSNF